MYALFNNANKQLGNIYTALTNLFVGAASTNTFTMPAAATKTVTDATVKASSYVIVFPLNAAAATLQGSAKCLYTAAAAGSFTALTASGGNAAGSENFGYLVLNLA